jgi:hypothetical protein
MPDNYTSIRVGNDVYVHCKQDKTDECTICCAGMIIARKKGRFVPRAELRALSQGVGPEGSGYRPSAKDAGAPVSNPAAAALANIMIAKQGPSGAGTIAVQNLPAILSHYSLATDAGGGDGAAVAAKLRAAVTQGQIASASVFWDGGGGHSIVVAGKTKIKGTDYYIILDPGTDAQLVTTTPVGATQYNAPYGGSGRFGQWIIVTG